MLLQLVSRSGSLRLFL